MSGINPFTGKPFIIKPVKSSTNFTPSLEQMYPGKSTSYSVPRSNVGGSRRRTRTRRHLKKHKRVHHTRRKQSRRHRHSRRRHH